MVSQEDGLSWETSFHPTQIEEAVVEVETEGAAEMESENCGLLISSVDNGGGVVLLDHAYTKSAASEPAEETKQSREQLQQQNKQLLNELRNVKLKNRSIRAKLLDCEQKIKMLKQIAVPLQHFTGMAKELFENQIKNGPRREKNRAYSLKIIDFALIQRFYSNSGK